MKPLWLFHPCLNWIFSKSARARKANKGWQLVRNCCHLLWDEWLELGQGAEKGGWPNPFCYLLLLFFVIFCEMSGWTGGRKGGDPTPINKSPPAAGGGGGCSSVVPIPPDKTKKDPRFKKKDPSDEKTFRHLDFENGLFKIRHAWMQNRDFHKRKTKFDISFIKTSSHGKLFHLWKWTFCFRNNSKFCVKVVIEGFKNITDSRSFPSNINQVLAWDRKYNQVFSVTFPSMMISSWDHLDH